MSAGSNSTQAPELADLTRSLLETIGEDPRREGLARTPDRVARSWRDLTAGYDQTVEEVVERWRDASGNIL